MLADAEITIENGVAQPDPATNPEDVPLKLLVDLPLSVHARSGQAPTKIILLLKAPAAEGATVAFHALEETTAAQGPGDRFFGLVGSIALVGGTVSQITGAVPPGGKFYVRRTADTLTQPRQLLIKMAP